MCVNATQQNPNAEYLIRENTNSIAKQLEENPNAASRCRPTYKCRDCNNEYNSFQALGGHRASHKKLIIETGARSSPEETPSSKLHECRICKKGFAIGQALGGHMRKHRGIVVLSRLASSSSSVTSNSNGKEVFEYDLNLLPHENELINIYWGSITKRKFL